MNTTRGAGSRRTRRLAGAAALVLTMAGLAACGDDEAADDAAVTTTTGTTVDLVGALDDDDTYVAIVADEESVRAYVCNGEAGEAATTSEWFSGEVVDGEIDLLSAGGARLQATIADGGAEGTFVAGDGSVRPIRVEPARGDAGLYRGESDDVLGGFIVANDGTDRGGIGQLGGIMGLQLQRPAFQPSNLAVALPDGGRLQFQRVAAG